MQNAPKAIQAWGGSNRDVVANRRAIRMANMSAAEVLKAELAGLSPVKPTSQAKPEKAEEVKAFLTVTVLHSPIVSHPLIIDYLSSRVLLSS